MSTAQKIRKSMAPTRKPVYITSDPALMEQLDSFRFNNRFRTNSKAVRFLLDWALRNHPLCALTKEKL